MGGAGVHFTVTQEEEPADNSPLALNNCSIPRQQGEKEQDSLLEEKALSFHLEEGCSRAFLVKLGLSLCQEESINSLLEAPSALREEGLTIFQVVQTSTLRTGQTNTLQRQEDSSSLQAE